MLCCVKDKWYFSVVHNNNERKRYIHKINVIILSNIAVSLKKTLTPANGGNAAVILLRRVWLHA